MRWLALLATVALVGCTGGQEGLVRLDPPRGTELEACPPPATRALAISFRAVAVEPEPERGLGIHRVGPASFLWVWVNENASLREDRITRVNPVHVGRDAEGLLHVCTQVDVASPIEVDRERRDVRAAARLDAPEGLPPGPLRVVVNWVVGCPCDPLPKGNDTAFFD